MCMKYVNATVTLFLDVRGDLNGGVLNFERSFDRIQAQRGTDEVLCLPGFKIVTDFCLLGTMDKEKKANNLVEQKGVLEVIVRMTKCSEREDERLKTDLDSFEIDTSDSKNRIENACFPYVNFTRITSVQDLKVIPGSGSYVIKILVREKTIDNSKVFSIQAMYPLFID